MGLAMLAISWFGNWLHWRGRLETTRWFLWCATLAFPAGFVAVLSGWFTAEVGRQPWVVWGFLRTADAAFMSVGAIGCPAKALVPSTKIAITDNVARIETPTPFHAGRRGKTYTILVR